MSHMRKSLLIHQILPRIMETTGSSRCHVRNSLGNSLGVISRNENRHAKITSRKCLCLNSVLPCVNSRGILSMCFLVGKLYMWMAWLCYHLMTCLTYLNLCLCRYMVMHHHDIPICSWMQVHPIWKSCIQHVIC